MLKLALFSCFFFLYAILFAQVTLVKDINPKNAYSGNGNPSNIVSWQGKLYFTASNDTLGFQLWQTDGTLSRTKMALNIRDFTLNNKDEVYEITPLKTKLLLSILRDGISQNNLFFLTNGSVSNASAIKKEIRQVALLTNKTLLFIQDSVFGLNETNNNLEYIHKTSTLFYDFFTGKQSGSRYYFSSINNFNSSNEYCGIYTTNGTPNGYKTIHSTATYSTRSSNYGIVAVNNDVVYFRVCDELWKSDGDASTNKLIMDFGNGICNENVNNAVNVVQLGNKLFIVAYGKAYLMDMDKDISPRLLTTLSYGSLYNISLIHDKVLFFCYQGSDNYLVSLDINSGELTELARFLGKVSVGEVWYTQSSDKLFFCGDENGAGWEPYESDGTIVGTKIISDIRSVSGSSTPKYFTIHNDTLYFQAFEPFFGAELYSYTETKIPSALDKEELTNKSKEVIKAVNVFGQEMENYQNYTGLVILLYSDGSIQKRILVK